MKHTTHEIVLKNGSKGLLIDIPDASVMTFDINFRGGEYLVERPKWETAHLMEHVLFGANEVYRKARHFQAEFEKNGAYSNASTSSYDITYEAECADSEWQRIVELLLLAISRPLFLKEEFTAEIGNVKEELSARSNNHFRHLSLRLREAFGFISATDQERLKMIKNVSLKDIRDHYQKTHTTSNMRFVVAGQLNQSRRQQLKTYFENMELPKGSRRYQLPREHPKSLDRPLYINNSSVKNIFFYLDTFMNRRLAEPERDALSLINTILTETFYSKILGTAREKGLIYSMSSGFGQSRLSTNWWFGAQILPKNTEALIGIVNKEISKVQKGQLDINDIIAAKQYSIGRYQRSGQTVNGTAAGYAGWYFFDDTIDDYYKVPQRLNAVTSKAIVEITRALFNDNIWGLGVLGNCGQEFAEGMSDQLAGLWANPNPRAASQAAKRVY